MTDDHLATIARAVATAFDHVLRGVHSATEFGVAVSDIQSFLDEFLSIAKEGSAGPAAYLKLCETHQKNLHKFLHALAKNSPELKKEFLTWYAECMKVYTRRAGEYVPPKTNSGLNEVNSAGALTPELSKLVEALSEADRVAVLSEIEAYASWLSVLSSKSSERTNQLLDPTSSEKSQVAPGVYLALWEDMIASTGITPAELVGPVRSGTTNSAPNSSRKDDGEPGEDAGPALIAGTGKLAPKMERTRAVLMKPFEKLLIEKCMS